MKTFLDAWLLEAPTGFSQELAGMVKLVPADPIQGTVETISFQIELSGGLRGAFWVLADVTALGSLLKAARITTGEPDRSRDAQRWQSIVRQVAERAARSLNKAAKADVSVSSVHEGQRPDRDSFVFYELRFGEAVVRMAFDDKTSALIEEKTTMHTHETSATRGIDLLLDVELDASLRFGSREMPLSEVLELGPGDVVPLERHVADPVDLIVGDKIVARGEVVLVNGNFGLRITEVAEPRKSLESIRCLF
ncbi:MAG TPA: flagellar motor switch protein FliN [Pseudacidobacterium sp.]|jgi:flagellar motor switch protein FliN|nr:flagellar motor switch protein FliN [Pseudacidobacterium sp.]